ncbi:F-box protein ASCRUDRAFT_71448 [Ascoidea rubescens DSM 1968]|uniref:F-box domain-containing protein n=1 Tax=Ascoidea rubescens DSM 1968 TaxID=1344418 RepID=A0A1D2VE49_9ASCO|nr:hypothetical protein ASCRUDRAFT_71448 [Ascoidea rubescens DSM 1968]ODV59978.1 hypothetical protein ASCRUDRAFT_71448 [Ascoidea rubescens DSM 1968]
MASIERGKRKYPTSITDSTSTNDNENAKKLLKHANSNFVNQTNSKWLGLPNELLNAILRKLDIVSLYKFSTICKNWRYYINSTYLAHEFMFNRNGIYLRPDSYDCFTKNYEFFEKLINPKFNANIFNFLLLRIKLNFLNYQIDDDPIKIFFKFSCFFKQELYNKDYLFWPINNKLLSNHSIDYSPIQNQSRSFSSPNSSNSTNTNIQNSTFNVNHFNNSNTAINNNNNNNNNNGNSNNTNIIDPVTFSYHAKNDNAFLSYKNILDNGNSNFLLISFNINSSNIYVLKLNNNNISTCWPVNNINRPYNNFTDLNLFLPFSLDFLKSKFSSSSNVNDSINNDTLNIKNTDNYVSCLYDLSNLTKDNINKNDQFSLKSIQKSFKYFIRSNKQITNTSVSICNQNLVIANYGLIEIYKLPNLLSAENNNSNYPIELNLSNLIYNQQFPSKIEFLKLSKDSKILFLRFKRLGGLVLINLTSSQNKKDERLFENSQIEIPHYRLDFRMKTYFDDQVLILSGFNECLIYDTRSVTLEMLQDEFGDINSSRSDLLWLKFSYLISNDLSKSTDVDNIIPLQAPGTFFCSYNIPNQVGISCYSIFIDKKILMKNIENDFVFKQTLPIPILGSASFIFNNSINNSLNSPSSYPPNNHINNPWGSSDEDEDENDNNQSKFFIIPIINSILQRDFSTFNTNNSGTKLAIVFKHLISYGPLAPPDVSNSNERLEARLITINNESINRSSNNINRQNQSGYPLSTYHVFLLPTSLSALMTLQVLETQQPNICNINHYDIVKIRNSSDYSKIYASKLKRLANIKDYSLKIKDLSNFKYFEIQLPSDAKLYDVKFLNNDTELGFFWDDECHLYKLNKLV